MSVLIRLAPQGMTRDQYESVKSSLEEAGDWPADGCQIHVCFGDEGNLRVSEIWEYKEKLEAFGETLRPRLEEAGIQMSGEPELLDVVSLQTF
jgi:hypothetical protein